MDGAVWGLDMNVFLAVSGAMGGIVAFAGGVWTIARAIGKQISATKDNTEALMELAGTVKSLDTAVQDNTTRISRLEGKVFS